MQYPYYNTPDKFSPRMETLRSWLKTRKSNDNPGLFLTEDYSRDSVWTTIAILIELSAVFLTSYGAIFSYLEKHKIGTLTGAIIFVFLFVAFDIIGILLHGHDKPDKVILRSQMRFEKDDDNKRHQFAALNRISLRTFFGVILLLFSGILKIVAIGIFFKGITLPGQVILVLFYLVVIYIHIFHTGYWLAAIGVKKAIDNDYKQFLYNRNQQLNNPFLVTQPTIRPFISPVPMNAENNSFNNGRQTIKFINRTEENNGAVIFHYELISEGCMWGEEVTLLCNRFQEREFNRSLIDASISLQLSQIGIIV